DDTLDAIAPQALEGGKGCRDLGQIAQAFRQHEGIFQRQRDALTDVWTDRVRGVSDQADALAMPAWQRENVVDRVTADPIGVDVERLQNVPDVPRIVAMQIDQPFLPDAATDALQAARRRLRGLREIAEPVRLARRTHRVAEEAATTEHHVR